MKPVMDRRQEGAPVALEDACWHRMLPLSKGHLDWDQPVCGYRGLVLGDNADLVVGYSHKLIALNLARLARFDDTIDTELSRRDHCLGSTTRGRKGKQFEENVQLDELTGELEAVPWHRYVPKVRIESRASDL